MAGKSLENGWKIVRDGVCLVIVDGSGTLQCVGSQRDAGTRFELLEGGWKVVGRWLENCA